MLKIGKLFIHEIWELFKKQTFRLSAFWHNFQIIYFIQALSQFKTPIKKRYKDAVSDAHIIAFMTNPKFGMDWETELEEDEIKSAEEWLSGRDPDYGIELEKYRIRDESLYNVHMFNDRLVILTYCVSQK